MCGNPYDKGIPIESDNVIDNARIFYGITSFSNIASSMLLINQMVSGDDWSSFMYNLMDVDSPVFAIIYCLSILIIGNFFIMNLILAVIGETYETLEEEKEEQKKRKALLDEEFDQSNTPS